MKDDSIVKYDEGGLEDLMKAFGGGGMLTEPQQVVRSTKITLPQVKGCGCAHTINIDSTARPDGSEISVTVDGAPMEEWQYTEVLGFISKILTSA